MLTFDPIKHQYQWNGQPVPGVTSILNEWLKVTIVGERYHVNRFNGVAIPSWKMEEAGQSGTDIHKGCELIMQGGIDWDGLDPAYAPPLRQFEKFMAELKPNILYSEAAIYHPKYRYAGTIDIIAMIGKALCFIDIKTGDSGAVGPQLAAYERGWCAQDRYLGRTERYALWLPKDGSPYKFEQLKNENDFEFFKSCMFQNKYLKGAK